MTVKLDTTRLRTESKTADNKGFGDSGGSVLRRHICG